MTQDSGGTQFLRSRVACKEIPPNIHTAPSSHLVACAVFGTSIREEACTAFDPSETHARAHARLLYAARLQSLARSRVRSSQSRDDRRMPSETGPAVDAGLELPIAPAPALAGRRFEPRRGLETRSPFPSSPMQTGYVTDTPPLHYGIRHLGPYNSVKKAVLFCIP